MKLDNYINPGYILGGLLTVAAFIAGPPCGFISDAFPDFWLCGKTANIIGMILIIATGIVGLYLLFRYRKKLN